MFRFFYVFVIFLYGVKMRPKSYLQNIKIMLK